MRAESVPCAMVTVAPRITADDDVCHGQPVIKGTRVPVSVVVGQLSAGAGVDLVATEYDITRDDVLAALAYAASVLSSEQVRAL